MITDRNLNATMNENDNLLLLSCTIHLYHFYKNYRIILGFDKPKRSSQRHKVRVAPPSANADGRGHHTTVCGTGRTTDGS